MKPVHPDKYAADIVRDLHVVSTLHPTRTALYSLSASPYSTTGSHWPFSELLKPFPPCSQPDHKELSTNPKGWNEMHKCTSNWKVQEEHAINVNWLKKPGITKNCRNSLTRIFFKPSLGNSISRIMQIKVWAIHGNVTFIAENWGLNKSVRKDIVALILESKKAQHCFTG